MSLYDLCVPNRPTESTTHTQSQQTLPSGPDEVLPPIASRGSQREQGQRDRAPPSSSTTRRVRVLKAQWAHASSQTLITTYYNATKQTGGQQPRDWHLILRNLPFALCKPEGADQLKALINAHATALGLRTRRLQPLSRKEDGLPTGVVFVLLEREGNGRVDVEEGALAGLIEATSGKDFGGRPLKAARWVRPTPSNSKKGRPPLGEEATWE